MRMHNIRSYFLQRLQRTCVALCYCVAVCYGSACDGVVQLKNIFLIDFQDYFAARHVVMSVVALIEFDLWNEMKCSRYVCSPKWKRKLVNSCMVLCVCVCSVEINHLRCNQYTQTLCWRLACKFLLFIYTSWTHRTTIFTYRCHTTTHNFCCVIFILHQSAASTDYTDNPTTEEFSCRSSITSVNVCRYNLLNSHETIKKYEKLSTGRTHTQSIRTYLCS